MSRILVVDDEKAVRDSIRMILEYEKFAVEFAEDGPSALEKAEHADVDLILLDIKMPGMDGMKVLERLRDLRPSIPVTMISGHGTYETAVEATRLGAYDFLQKPLDKDKLLIVVRNAIEYKRLRELQDERDAILGQSEKIKEVLALIKRVAPTDARVLITGENGSGKELVARAIHRLSWRAQKQLVEVNCAAIPNELIESELFGHEKGAFTGAANQRIGKFELADGGTLFLDEIGDMSLSAQAKVLRALEEGKIERVGGNKQIAVNVRVLAATNRNLPDAIHRSLFREDLYHRLNVIPIDVPPLRDRRDDIPLLVRAFTVETCKRNGLAQRTFTDETLRALQQKDWPGNVRELRNTVERLVIMSPLHEIGIETLGAPVARHAPVAEDFGSFRGTFQEFKDYAESVFIRKQLELNDWNITKTAEALDIQRSHLYNKMKKYGLTRGDEKGEE